jgi:hypothetical protein
MRARDLLGPGQTALVIFTDGSNFDIEEGSFGRPGRWRLREGAAAHKVIIYFRNKAKNANEVFVADFVRLHHPQEESMKRSFAIEFTNTKLAGHTDANWIEFTGSKRGASSAVKYIK